MRPVKVHFPSGEITLAGTLTLPATGGAPYPAFVLVSGSGPMDRDENSPNGDGLKNSFFKHLAYHLSQAGYAALRYDDRGIGESEGDFARAGFSDFAGDAKAALDYLRGRDDIDSEALGLMGHSEGALIALRLSSVEDSKLRNIVLLGCPAKPLDEVLRELLTLLGVPLAGS